MEHLMTRQLDRILKEGGAEYDWQTELEVNPKFLDLKGKAWLQETMDELGGKGNIPFRRYDRGACGPLQKKKSTRNTILNGKSSGDIG